ncbi:MAG: hypothetical protein O9308_00085 [Beijerinckiaceae bacterium]|nr:hypothetical protein [Beijerinckiaceae bacterium]
MDVLWAMLMNLGYGLEVMGAYSQQTIDVVTAFWCFSRQERVESVAAGEIPAKKLMLFSSLKRHP